MKSKPPKTNPLPEGAPAEVLLKFMGTISPEDAEHMRRFIEEWCERIDNDPIVQFPDIKNMKTK